MINLFDRVVDFATIGTALMVGYDFLSVYLRRLRTL